MFFHKFDLGLNLHKMKQKLSVTIEEDKIKLLEKLLREGKFRSKSHIIEYSLNKYLQEIKK